MKIKVFRKQSGQVLLILLLVMTVGLGIALSVIGRSLSDISSSTKLEQSTRAFSVAEAGIERALRGDTNGVNFTDNSSQATVYDSGLLPGNGQALEYPPISKEEIAQFWLANPATTPPTNYYTQSSINVYWGTTNLAPADQAALEITVVYLSGTTITSKKYYLDPNSSRAATNGFSAPTNCSNSGNVIATTLGVGRMFYCRSTLDLTGMAPNLYLARMRLLYTSISQSIAFVPVGTCGSACSLPPQAETFTSIGSSGDTQRALQLSTFQKVVPFYFDYAIFSQADIKK